MKTLKFRKTLADLILARKKNITWRLFDDKDLSPGDKVKFIVKETGQVFAMAKLIRVKTTTFGKLQPEDWAGHEKYKTKREMYKTYSGYYNRIVNRNTPLKVVWFEVLKRFDIRLVTK